MKSLKYNDQQTRYLRLSSPISLNDMQRRLVSSSIVSLKQCSSLPTQTMIRRRSNFDRMKKKLAINERKKNLMIRKGIKNGRNQNLLLPDLSKYYLPNIVQFVVI